jgi:hypothetical protein
LARDRPREKDDEVTGAAGAANSDQQQQQQTTPTTLPSSNEREEGVAGEGEDDLPQDEEDVRSDEDVDANDRQQMQQGGRKKPPQLSILPPRLSLRHDAIDELSSWTSELLSSIPATGTTANFDLDGDSDRTRSKGALRSRSASAAVPPALTLGSSKPLQPPPRLIQPLSAPIPTIRLETEPTTTSRYHGDGDNVADDDLDREVDAEESGLMESQSPLYNELMGMMQDGGRSRQELLQQKRGQSQLRERPMSMESGELDEEYEWSGVSVDEFPVPPGSASLDGSFFPPPSPSIGVPSSPSLYSFPSPTSGAPSSSAAARNRASQATIVDNRASQLTIVGHRASQMTVTDSNRCGSLITLGLQFVSKVN